MTDELVTHSYHIHYPPHEPREADPFYHLFEAYRAAHLADARCYVGEHVGFDQCQGGLELHHAHLEDATINAADIEAVARDYPSVHDEDSLRAWAESAENFRFLCVRHHRSREAGAHALAHADWEASVYEKGLTS